MFSNILSLFYVYEKDKNGFSFFFFIYLVAWSDFTFKEKLQYLAMFCDRFGGCKDKM